MATASNSSLKPIANSNGTFSVGNQTFKDITSATKAYQRRTKSAAMTANRVETVNNTPINSPAPINNVTPNIPTNTTNTTPTDDTVATPIQPKTTVLPFSKDNESYKQLIAKGYDDTKIMEMYNKAKADSAALVAKNKPAEPATIEPTTIEPATIEPVKPAEMVTPAKTDVGVLAPLELSEYQDDSSARQNEIVSNLNSYRQTNPEFLTDLDTFKKTFSYGLRSDEQKELLNNRYLGYQKGVKLNNMGIDSIVDQYGSGNISSSDLEQLRLNNPAKYQEAMAAIEQKDIVRTYQNELYETDEQKTIMAQLDEVSGQGSIFDEYKKTINSEEVIGLQSEIADMETQREQLNLELNDIQDQVEKRYEGTGATKGKIAYIVAKESAALQKQITSLGIDSANRIDKYNSIVNTAKETMQLQLQEQEAERAARNQKMSELGFYYEYDPVGMAERAENIFNIENPDINSSNANTARRALNNELTKYYEQYGDIIIRPQSQALNDIIAQAKTDGTSLSAALKKNFTDQLQSKQLYGQTLGKSLGFDMGSYSMTQQADGNWTVGAKTTYGAGSVASFNSSPTSRSEVQSNLSSIVSSTGSNDLSTIAQSINNSYSDGLYGGQCGEFSNDIASAIGSSVHFGDTLESKTNLINAYTPEVGSFVVMDSAASPKNGHVGMVTAINGDGTMQVKSSNYKGDEKVRTDTISVNSGAIKGYVKPEVNISTKASKLEENSNTFDQYLEQGSAALGGSAAERQASLSDMGYNSQAEFNIDYNNWLQNKVEEAPDPGFITALEYVTENPLFDYTDASGVKHKGLLSEQGIVDSATIATIENNLMMGQQWNKNLGLKTILKLNKYTRIGDFAESLRTIRNSKVIDIVKTGKVKLYPMSDADIGLLAGSVGLQMQSFAQPDKAKGTYAALNSLLNKYKTQAGGTTTTTAPTTPFDFLGGNNNIGSSRMSNLNSLID